jgi:beta-glucanase (GH16 family)
MIKFILFISLTLCSAIVALSQNEDIIYEQINENDTALINLTDYTGKIQWQSSADNKTWHNIESETKTTLLIKVNEGQYFRAMVTYGTCAPFYSSITFIENGSDIDDDNDGYTENQGDCNDNDPTQNPGAIDLNCGDGIDQNCDGRDCDALYFYEPFDVLANRWQIQLYGFYENGSNMIAENVNIENSTLSLSVTHNENEKLPLKYNAGEISDSAFHQFGYFEVRMKPAIVPGTVASFFIMNRWVPENWEHREIDIEFTGNKLTSMQMTTHDYQEGGTNHKFSTTIKELGFNITEDFHNYGILWTQDSVSWFVDCELFHTEKQYVPQDPLHIRLNHWAGNMEAGMDGWMGMLNDETLPSITYYDWIKVMSIEGYLQERRNDSH